MAKLITPERLMEVSTKAIPKGLPKTIIKSVEVDTFGNSERSDGISYWVYLRTHYVAEGGHGCHTIHEDTLSQVKSAMADIIYVEDDDVGYGE